MGATGAVFRAEKVRPVRRGFPLPGRPWWNPEHSPAAVQHHKGPSFLLSSKVVWKTMFLSEHSGIHSTIHGKIRPGNVRRLRTADKRPQPSNLINAPVAVECRGGLLRYRPFARGGVQILVDRARREFVDFHVPGPHLSG